VPAGAQEIPDPALCRVGGESLSDWLVAQGWAEAAGGAYAPLEDSARQDGLGLWGAGRPGAHDDVADSAPDSALPISARVSAMP
jgi:endonuclease YncB( thermonuclease family)